MSRLSLFVCDGITSLNLHIVEELCTSKRGEKILLQEYMLRMKRFSQYFLLEGMQNASTDAFHGLSLFGNIRTYTKVDIQRGILPERLSIRGAKYHQIIDDIN